MRVLMLGWEFPPFITGGLGTACHGLTRALSEAGTNVTFVLPQSVPDDAAAHVRLLSPDSITPESPASSSSTTGATELLAADMGGVDIVRIGTSLPDPYTGQSKICASISTSDSESGDAVATTPGDTPHSPANEEQIDDEYGGDVIAKVQRYAQFADRATRDLDGQFDVIHAHDWMTYPAGLRLAKRNGLPLVVHVHSTEFDRSGEHVNQAIYDIERAGMHGADGVITVSALTKGIVQHRYDVPEQKIHVVYNGVELQPAAAAGLSAIRRRDRIVLFFGRITYQKGPEYFLKAAQKVLELEQDVKFVVAGSGDMASCMMDQAAEMGMADKVLFTGFLRGDDISRVFAMADLYVMPSVSEPFGIAPLEAMGHDVPVLISRSSGVSEVLTHALKVDFWHTAEMANKIVAILRHPPLGRTLREHGRMEVRGLTWADAAQRCCAVYESACANTVLEPVH